MGCGTTIFGPSSQYIKILGGDFVAIQGSNTVEKLITNDLKIPYDQIMKSTVILQPGQSNYLLNSLGLGNNATFLLIRATYDPGSVIEEDNYIQYNYYDDLTKSYYMAQLLLLTGNSSNRVKQIYITNPNADYPVTLNVMTAVIDDNFSPFVDTLNQTGTTFTGLNHTDIQSFVVGRSIIIYDKSTPPLPLIYVQLSNINSIQSSGTIIIINDSSLGSIFLQFLTQFDANQAQSLLSYLLVHPTTNISSLNPVADLIPPTIFFWNTVGDSINGSYISFDGATAGPYDTTYGYTFSTNISLSEFGTSSVIDKDLLSGLLINGVTDNRDGVINIIPSENLLLYGYTLSGTVSIYGSSVSNISATGYYGLSFNLSDIAKNYTNGFVNLNILP